MNKKLLKQLKTKTSTNERKTSDNDGVSGGEGEGSSNSNNSNDLDQDQGQSNNADTSQGDNLCKKRSLREKKATIIKDIGYIEKDKSIKSLKNPATIETFKKCEKIFVKLKRHIHFQDFYKEKLDEVHVPSLSQVEKNLKSYKYETVFEFGMDIRKIFNHYFSNYSKDDQIYKKTFALSNFFEMNFKDATNLNEEKVDLDQLKNQIDKLTKDIKDMGKGSQNSQNQGQGILNGLGNGNQQNNSIHSKKQDSKISFNNNSYDKPMTNSEKKALGANVRLLTQEQLKGVVSIVTDGNPVNNGAKMFEIDIDNLPLKKLRELDRYIKMCLKTKSITPKNVGLNQNQLPTTYFNVSTKKFIKG